MKTRVILTLLAVFVFVQNVSSSSGVDEAQLHIVYLGGTRSQKHQSILATHEDILTKATGSVEMARASLVYSYKYGFSGFAAHLTQEQAAAMSAMPEVISVFQSRSQQLLTTRSWDFLGLQAPEYMGLENSEMPSSSKQQDVIIGIIDTGAWPESQSFSDEGMGPVPSRWKGSCVNPPGTNASKAVHCNRKIIGARSYYSRVPNSKPTARDDAGHGSMTASIAAGRRVPGVANYNGLANGTARGGAPLARIAIYKVCWGFSCDDADVLAAIDDAINDGVDIISLSLGSPPTVYHDDVNAIGAFHAIERGIFVSLACGNSGQFEVTNAAPWMLTVGASTIDRKLNYLNNQTIMPYKPAPVVESFSSTGPNVIDPAIIKPDVTAPGVDILGAWSPMNYVPTNFTNGTFSDFKGNLSYYVASGTSFACPHATGAVAYLKSLFPKWSPAMIKSAIMTTANNLDNTNRPISDGNGKELDLFSYGSGLVQPVRAADPGLVYDTSVSDYVMHLCSLGYTQEQLRNITGDMTECPTSSSTFNLNYPSIGFHKLRGTQVIPRTATNVGPPNSVYEVILEIPSDGRLSISVNPGKLSFQTTMQSLSYNVTISTSKQGNDDNLTWVFSSLTWTDGVHRVRSPIAVSI